MVLRGSKTAPTDSLKEALESSKTHSDERLMRVCKQLLAGGIAGGIARTIVAPFDRIKILMQTQSLLLNQQQATAPTSQTFTPPSNTSTTATNAIPTTASKQATSVTPDKYQRIYQSFRLLIQEEGSIKSLWRGNFINVLRVLPYSALQFASYDLLKHEFPLPLTTTHRLISGAFAATIATTLTHPLDVIRLRQTVHPHINTVYLAVKDITRDGYSALFKGYIPTVLSVAPFIAINFATFDTLKSHFSHIQSTPLTLTLGAVSGLTAQTICYPLDTIRRRMQLRGQVYRNMFDAIKSMYLQEGMSSFYKGMMPNAIKIIPMAAIRFWSYEIMRKMLGIKGGVGDGG